MKSPHKQNGGITMGLAWREKIAKTVSVNHEIFAALKVS
jgi:hypothetical protein